MKRPPRRHRKHPLFRRSAWLGFGVMVPVFAAGIFAFSPRPPHGTAARLAAAAAAQEPARERSVPLTPETMQALGARLADLCRSVPARGAAVYVQDIDSGLTAAVNPNREFLAASLIKLPVMATTYARWERDPDEKSRRALQWMEQMITVSDNASTDRLIDLVGGPEVVTRFCTERHWPDIQVRHAILNHRGRRGLNQVTAREITAMLVALDQRQLVSPEADAEMWQVMLRQKHRNRIPAGVPKLPGVVVGNKTGTLGNVLHDAGIVHTPTRRYALTILLDHQRSDAAGEKFCARVSRTVFDALNIPPRLDVATAQ